MATRSRVVATDADMMLTWASESTRVTSESSRVRSSASTWTATRNTDAADGAHSTSTSRSLWLSKPATLAQSGRCTDTPLPRVTKPMIAAPGTDVWVKLARCCTPVPGDAIIGFVTRGNGVSVHRPDCANVAGLLSQSDRLVEVEWAPSAASVFLVAVQVEALDRTRLLSDVNRELSDSHVNIMSASVATTRDRVAISRFTFEM